MNTYADSVRRVPDAPSLPDHLDSLGVGALPDAASFGDAGTHTLDHIVEATGRTRRAELERARLGNIAGVRKVEPAAHRAAPSAVARNSRRARTHRPATGEMMGCVLEQQFPVFPSGFPRAIVDQFVARAKLPGILCNTAASGTEVIERFGAEHIASGSRSSTPAPTRSSKSRVTNSTSVSSGSTRSAWSRARSSTRTASGA